jgi:drug/metabolite transporter (DMT)-like permease
MNRKRVWTMIFAFTSVYLFWGGTYLGMKIALEAFPPFLMAGIRHLSAGLILLTLALLKKESKPKPKEIMHAVVVGVLMLLMGNGLVAYAELSVPSSIASLIITTVPFWIVLLNALFGEKKAPKLLEIFTLILAFMGIMLMVFQGEDINVARLDPLGISLLLLASFSWAIGSLYSRWMPGPKSSYYSIASQTIGGSVFLFMFSFAIQDMQKFSFSNLTSASIIAMGYLIIFGSVFAFSAYIWLMKNVSPTLASSNAFVNPVVALFLGVVFAKEVLSQQSLMAAGIIISAVILLSFTKRTKKVQ